MAFFYEKGKQGLIDREGKVLDPPILERASAFSKEEGKAFVYINEERWTLTKTGELTYTPVEEERWALIKTGELTYTTKEKKSKVNYLFRRDEEAEREWKETLFGPYWPYLDEKYQLMLPVDGFYPLFNGELWGFVNLEGELVIPFQFYFFEGRYSPFSKGLILLDDRQSFANAKGEVVLKGEWEARDFGHFGWAPVAHDGWVLFGEWGFMDQRGELVFKLNGHVFYDAFPFTQEGLACVSLFPGTEKDRMGYINGEGELAFSTRWVDVDDFWEGTADVEDIDGTHYAINTQGEVLSILWYKK